MSMGSLASSTVQLPSGRFGSGTIVPDFLSYIDNPSSMPSWEAPNTLVKYYVTTEAVRQVSK